MKLEWELVEEQERYCTQRARLPTGWLVKHNEGNRDERDYKIDDNASMTFVYDPEHLWEVR